MRLVDAKSVPWIHPGIHRTQRSQLQHQQPPGGPRHLRASAARRDCSRFDHSPGEAHFSNVGLRAAARSREEAWFRIAALAGHETRLASLVVLATLTFAGVGVSLYGACYGDYFTVK